MTIKQRIASWAIKALSHRKMDETYTRAIYHQLSNNQILWMPNDTVSYVNDAFYTNPEVYNAVLTIVNMASRSPINLYKVKDAKKAEKYKAMTRGLVDSKSMSDILKVKAQAFEEVDKEHPVLKLLQKPNEWQSEADFRANRLGFRLVTGNYYMYKSFPQVGSKLGEPVSLYLLPSQYMQIISGGLMEPVKSYVNCYNGGKEPIEAEKIIHNRAWSLDYSYAGSHLFGISPIKAATKSITLNNWGREAWVTELQNGGAKGVMSIDQSDDDFKASLPTVKEKFQEQSGVENRGLPVFTNNKVEWHQLGLNAVELSILEALKASGIDIYKVFGIDVNMFNTDASSYNNKKEAIKHTLFMAVIPLLISDRDSLNHGLMPHFDKTGQYFLDYDLTVYSELNENRKELFDALKTAEWLTPNEKRVESGYDSSEDPNMDKFYFSNSLEELSRINTEMDLPNLPLTGDFE